MLLFSIGSNVISDNFSENLKIFKDSENGHRLIIRIIKNCHQQLSVSKVMKEMVPKRKTDN